MITIGVDPGKSGGIAWIGPDGPSAEPVKNMTDREIYRLLASLADEAQIAIIERVHSMPKQGVASSFAFGVSFGALCMAVAAAGIPFELASPAKWQKDMKCRTKGDKNVSKRRAQELFPELKVTHAIADALLIAEWGRRGFYIDQKTTERK